MRSSASSVDAREGTLFARRYRLLRRIGASSLGVRYDAEDERGSHYALKILAPEAVAAETFSQTVADAALISTISGSPVVPVIDAGEDGATGERFVATPLLVARSLASVLEETGPLPPMTAVLVALDVAAALSELHDRDLVHRNVRAENVLLEELEGGVLRVRVTDMGFSPPMAAVSTHMSEAEAKIASRVAPEVVFRNGIDKRTDVFAVGALLYEMLSGEPPWGRDVERITSSLMGKRVWPVQRLAPWVEPELALVVQRATMRDARERYRSAAELAQRLRALAPTTRDALTAEMFRALRPEERGVVAIKTGDDAIDPLSETLEGEVRDAFVGKKLGGRFLVIGLVGKGAMGAVYECRGERGEKLAAKLISREIGSGDQALIARFLREARAATQIESPNVTRTFELGADEASGVPFIVMELLEGRDLAAIYQERGALAGAPLARVFAQAARGLAAAHATGVVHRDVKPANLFLHVGESATPDAAPITVKICDFGVAKAVRSVADENEEKHGKTTNLTVLGKLLGTPMFMSPEQARNAKDVDPRSDVWSLCATLFTGLAGRGPWANGQTVGDILVAVSTTAPPALREVAPWVHPKLAAIVDRGLTVERDRRWPTAGALADALERFAGGSQVTLDDLVPAELESPHLPGPYRRSAWRAVLAWFNGAYKR